MKDDDPEFADSSSSENDDDADVSSVVYMVLVFLLKWQYMFNISDNALSVLIKFLHKLILIIIQVAKTKDDITNFTKDIPTSLYAVRKHAGLNGKSFKMFSSCPICHTINSNLDTKICRLEISNFQQTQMLQFAILICSKLLRKKTGYI